MRMVCKLFCRLIRLPNDQCPVWLITPFTPVPDTSAPSTPGITIIMASACSICLQTPDMSRLLPSIVTKLLLQAVLTGQPQLVSLTAALLHTVLLHDSAAMASLYRTGIFFFALAYCGSNLVELACLLQVSCFSDAMWCVCMPKGLFGSFSPAVFCQAQCMKGSSHAAC